MRVEGLASEMVTEATEHADEFVRIGVELLKSFPVEKTLFAGNETLADQFVERADGELDKTRKVLSRGSRTPLGDVGRD
jgi:hypothetical protein